MANERVMELADILQNKEQYASAEEVSSRKSGYRKAALRIQKQIGYGLDGVGSGLLLTPSGYFITNYHVLHNADKNIDIRIHGVLKNKKPFHTGLEKVVCISKVYDLALALCKIPEPLIGKLRESVPKIVLAKEQPRVGEEVRAYGFKEEAVEESQGKITDTTFFSIPQEIEDLMKSLKNGSMDHYDQKRKKHDATCITDCKAEQGWSGSPVIRETTGELLGITYCTTGYKEKKLDKLGFTSIKYVRGLLEEFVRSQGIDLPKSQEEKKEDGLLKAIKGFIFELLK